MVTLSSTSGSLPTRAVGIECFHGFGDGLFNAPFLETISRHHNCPVGVATSPHCADAFLNLPWVDEIIHINERDTGDQALKRLNYKTIHKITPSLWFYTFKAQDPNHSLIDTPNRVARELGYPGFDPRPIFRPTAQEMNTLDLTEDVPTIAIESVYFSQQSWATDDDFRAILAHYGRTHKIIWLSNRNQPTHPNVYQFSHLSRRCLIMCLARADLFFSVGSGFFCAALALPKNRQPKKTVCLWVDGVYRYKEPLAKAGWNENICWVDDRQQLHNDYL
jgi:hypothetical protein